ncbi:hypothetical protein BJV74DRAFT_888631 [Russula compacta]|nr:hypothetical protein BJV74DRAFT_888631 [Russula compacta]
MSKAFPSIPYFTYGSNMWREQMKKLYPNSMLLGIGILYDWRFITDELGWTNIVPHPEEHVYGFIYHLTPEDKEAMDKNEGTDYQTRKLHVELTKIIEEEELVKIEELDTKTVHINALIYLDPTHTIPGNPTEGTVHAMNQAIKDGLEAGIPQSYIDKYIRPYIREE